MLIRQTEDREGIGGRRRGGEGGNHDKRGDGEGEQVRGRGMRRRERTGRGGKQGDLKGGI